MKSSSKIFSLKTQHYTRRSLWQSTKGRDFWFLKSSTFLVSRRMWDIDFSVIKMKVSHPSTNQNFTWLQKPYLFHSTTGPILTYELKKKKVIHKIQCQVNWLEPSWLELFSHFKYSSAYFNLLIWNLIWILTFKNFVTCCTESLFL